MQKSIILYAYIFPRKSTMQCYLMTAISASARGGEVRIVRHALSGRRLDAEKHNFICLYIPS